MMCVINEVKDLYEILEELKKFAQKYNLELNDPRLPRLYEMEQDAIRDENSRLDFAKREGKREGLREGERKGILKAAMGMKIQGIAWDIISRITGLSINEISAI